LINGNVGAYDPIRAALNETGATELFHGVKMRPGKPVGLYHLNDVPVVTLPGNPFAAIVGYYFIVRSMIEAALGARIFGSSETKAVLSTSVSRRREVTEFVPVTLVKPTNSASPVATVIARGSSARLSPLVAADGLALLDGPGAKIAAGAKVPVFDFGGP